MTTTKRISNSLLCAVSRVMVLFVIAFTAVQASAASISFKHVGLEANISHPRVNNITVGSRGFAWISTFWGVDRFDGNELIPIRMPDFFSQGFEIYSTQELGSDSLLIKSSKGFLLYSRSRAEFLPADAFFHSIGVADVEDALVDNKFNLWMLSNDRITVQPAAGPQESFTLPPATRAIRACRTRFGVAILLSNGVILRCYAPNDGDMPAPQMTISPLVDGCRQMKSDFEGNLWALSAQGDSLWFSRLSGNEWELYNNSPTWNKGLPSNIIDFAPDVYGRVWLATEREGITILDLNTNTAIPLRHDSSCPCSLRSNTLTCIHSTAEGFVFVGYAFGGFSYYHPANFVFNDIKLSGEHLHLADVSSIATGAGKAYVASTSQGLLEVDIKTLTATQVAPPSLGPISSAAVQPDGTLWFCADGRKVGRRIKGGKPTILDSSLLPAAMRNGLPCQFSVDDAGNIWVASNDDVAVIPEGTSLADVIEFKVSDVVVSLSRPADGAGVVVLSRSDVLRATRSLFTIHVDTLVNQGIADFRPTDAVVDEIGNLWVTSLSSVRTYVRDNSRRFSQVASLDVNMPVSIVPNDMNGVVVATPTEAYTLRYAPSSRNPAPHLFTIYHRRHQPFSCGNANTYASCLMPDGTVWLGAEFGIVSYSPNIVKHEDISNITFCSLKANGKEVVPGQKFGECTPLRTALPYADHIQLPMSSDVFTIHFATPSHPDVSYVYLCELDGANQAPFKTFDPYFTFHNLQAGNYTLRVRVQDSHGIVSSDCAEINVSVRAPWRESTWAKGFMIIAGLMMAILFTYIIMSYRNAAKLNEMAKMQAEKALSVAEVKQLRREVLVGMASDLSTSLGPLSEEVRELTKLRGMQPEAGFRIQRLCDRVSATNLMIGKAIQTAEESDIGEFTPVRNDICAYVNRICESMREVTHGTVNLSFKCPVGSLIINFDPLMLRFVLVDILSDAVVAAQNIGSVDVKIEERGQFENVVVIKISVGGVDTSSSRYFKNKVDDYRPSVYQRLEKMKTALYFKQEGDGEYHTIINLPAN